MQKLTARDNARREAANRKVDRENRAWRKQRQPNKIRLITAHETELKFRHGHWQEKRSVIENILAQQQVSASAQHAFRNCGGELRIEWSATEQRHRLVGSFCHNRHCEPCMRQKANIIARNLNNRLADARDRQYRFVTLTLAHKPEDPLNDLLAKLRRCWKQFRNTPCWKTSQRGGAAMIEVKWSREGGWHPHLHIITEGTWVSQGDLKEAWERITNGSYKVDIRPLADKKGAAYYVGKYVRKGVNDEVWSDPTAASDWISCTRGLRTCATYGTWRGFALTRFESATKDWKPIGSLLTITDAARRGEEWAIGIMIDLMPSANPDEIRARYLEGDERLQMLTGDG